MKVKVAKLKTVALIALTIWSMSSFAQVETMMYVMKNGEVVFSSPVSGIDQVTFDAASPDSALIVNKNDGSLADKILLNDIQQLSFSDENLSVETSSGNEVYAYENVIKLIFGDINSSGINNPAKDGFDVIAYVTPEGDAVVKSSVPIKSLTLFGVDGKMISKQNCNGMIETLHAMSLQGKPSGVYLLRVETEQNTVVKRVVKPLKNKRL
ncbi:MAG: T9SS type A sorting domain-containing protein [Oscillospiraceae bacterium]|nr:T9SS type A sorting domain-containing protein [Oscillospiraceae bacterium]